MVASQRRPPTPTNPEDTPKRRSFRRISEARLANALDAMDLLALTADKTRYHFSNKDIEYIRSQLTERVEMTVEKFIRGNPRPSIRMPDLDDG